MILAGDQGIGMSLWNLLTAGWHQLNFIWRDNSLLEWYLYLLQSCYLFSHPSHSLWFFSCFGDISFSLSLYPLLSLWLSQWVAMSYFDVHWTWMIKDMAHVDNLKCPPLVRALIYKLLRQRHPRKEVLGWWPKCRTVLFFVSKTGTWRDNPVLRTAVIIHCTIYRK